MIAHLAGREKALHDYFEPDRAEWVALVCLHSGAFTRRQFSAYFAASKATATRFVERLEKHGMVRQTTLPELGITQIVRIVRKDLYRLLGIPNVRHRRPAKAGVMVSRLLSLDFVLEHRTAKWKPTEAEKVEAFTALGVSPDVLPSRIYAGQWSGNGRRPARTRRFFYHKLPVAVSGNRTDFVYTDPGHVTAAGLRTWAASHAALWAALREKRCQVMVTVVCRDEGQADRAQRVLKRWQTPQEQRRSGPARLSAKEARDLAAIRKAMTSGQVDKLGRWGGPREAAAKAGRLAIRDEEATDARVLITAAGCWVSQRLPPGDPRRLFL